MSLISEGSAGRGQTPPPPPSSASGRFSRPDGRPSLNAVRASKARAALRRDARRDELAVAHWLRELARPQR